MKSICLFAGYDSEGVIHDYVVYYISKLSEFSDVYYMADCEMQEEELGKLAPYVKGAYAQRHGKYDFGSWQELVRRIGWEKIREYDRLILSNDSCYGPLCPLLPIMEEMEGRQVDFWGMTRNLDPQPHLQSYFLVFNKRCLQGRELRDFLLNVKEEKDAKQVILKYEIPLTQYMEFHGYRSDAYVKCIVEDDLNRYTYSLPKLFRFPFIKVKNMKSADTHDFEGGEDSSEFFQQFPDYPSSLITAHTGQPFPKKKAGKVVAEEKNSEITDFLRDRVNIRIFVHFHIHYHEQIPYYLEKLKSLSRYDYDLYVTMTERDDFSEAILHNFKPSVIIRTVENRGYDVGPFISAIAETPLEEYDFVIKLHTKGFQGASGLFLEDFSVDFFRWRDALVDAFLSSEKVFNDCILMMKADKSIGIISDARLTLPYNVESPPEGDKPEAIFEEAERLIDLESRELSFEFVAGTIFLAKASLFMPIKNARVSIEEFELSVATGGEEFSKAHLYERLFGLMTYAAGLKICKISPQLDASSELLYPQGSAMRPSSVQLNRLRKKVRKYRGMTIILAVILLLAIIAFAIFMVWK